MPCARPRAMCPCVPMCGPWCARPGSTTLPRHGQRSQRADHGRSARAGPADSTPVLRTTSTDRATAHPPPSIRTSVLFALTRRRRHNRTRQFSPKSARTPRTLADALRTRSPARFWPHPSPRFPIRAHPEGCRPALMERVELVSLVQERLAFLYNMCYDVQHGHQHCAKRPRQIGHQLARRGHSARKVWEGGRSARAARICARDRSGVSFGHGWGQAESGQNAKAGLVDSPKKSKIGDGQ